MKKTGGGGERESLLPTYLPTCLEEGGLPGHGHPALGRVCAHGVGGLLNEGQEPGGNERLNALPPVLVVKYEACCASQAAIWARPVLNEFVWIWPIAPR